METVLQRQGTSAVRIFEILARIEQCITIRFDPKPIQLFKIFEYLPSPIYLFKYIQRRDCVSVRKKMFAVLLLTMVLTLLEVFILDHSL